MTEPTESSPPVRPTSVLCGSGIFSQLGSPLSMTSSGHFNPFQAYDGYKEIKLLDLPCTDCLMKVTGSRKREVSRWTNVGVPITTGGRPIYSSLEVPIYRINNKGVVRIIRQIADSPTNLDSEGSEKLNGEEVKVINPLVCHSSSTSPTKTPFNKFHSHLIPSTPRNFQPVLS
ncbi:hypothetical protein O181_079069 [Austropuccinia psidii MF-1]|uniref:Uncharacterized protein n=1 Tax=Austropuccinia psidii MF-1 TaxID=1389203 RepID=A0A9Q3FHR0_9BASI|nr:hypothetical protein [Austropuccinia psidii MF-1]